MGRRPKLSDDNGAALVIALIFITVVALVVSVLLSFTDASIRATVELRKQAAEAYTADGAAKVAINGLRKGTFINGSGQTCFDGGATLPLANFPTSQDGSARVECSPDPTSGAGTPGTLNSSNTPPNAVLTLGRDANAEAGVLVTSATNRVDTLETKGSIVSDSSLYVGNGDVLKSDTSIVGKSGPENCFGTLVAPVTSCATATPDPDPNYPAPTAAVTSRTVPSCNGNNAFVTLLPGLYTDAGALSSCSTKSSTLYFTKGTYYFNFASSDDTWTISSSSVVGGTSTTTLSGADPAMPGSCVSPLTSTTAAAGVQFVFGGVSHLEVGQDARVELCGSFSATTPPIVIYGLKTNVDVVPRLTGCLVALGGCPMLYSAAAATRNVMYVQGTIYTPTAQIALTYDTSVGNAAGQYVMDGIIARSITSLLKVASPVGVQVPDLTPGPKSAETTVLLKVYVCPGLASCSSGGRLQLEVKVGISNPAGTRSVKIYSWAVQR